MTSYIWRFNRDIMFFEPEEIYYIDSYYRKTYLHTATKSYQIAGKLNQTHQYLERENFVRIHQNYLVNPKHIKMLKKNMLILENGVELEISKRRKKYVYDLIWYYYKGKMQTNGTKLL